MNYYVSFSKGDRSKFESVSAPSIDKATEFASEYAAKGYVATVYSDGDILSILQPATEAELVLARVL